MKQLDDQIPTLQGELDFLKIQHLSQEEVISEATDLYTRWPALEHEEKRRIVENITQRITIGKIRGGNRPLLPPKLRGINGRKATRLHSRVAFLPY